MTKYGKVKHERQPLDLYETPPEATMTIMRELGLPSSKMWEPFAGSGKIADVLEQLGHSVFRSDITQYGAPLHLQKDFFQIERGEVDFAHVISNPPYGPRNSLVVPIVKRLLELRPRGGLIALLLPSEIDFGSTRSSIFGDCPNLRMQLKIMGRIRWFEGGTGTENHCWYVWGDPAQRQIVKYGSLK
jgi:hypothetical protein